jgi:formate dehydrogenase maturation protein FdhE
VTAEPAALEIDAGPWQTRRARAQELRERHPFAGELLALYLALLAVQEEAWSAFHESPPYPAQLPRWAADRVLPAVVQATVAAGPVALREAADSRLATGTAQDALAGWLAGADLDPVDRYLARASLAPALEALGERAGSSWSCSRSICPGCGESGEARLTTYAERWSSDAPPLLPHLRIAGCETCRRYLIEVDLERDPRAVPEVDELVALPLDLHAADEGLTKLTPNLMGF